MRYYAKAANTNQIIDRIKRHADGIEIQMLSKSQEIDSSLCDIISVHAPLFRGQDTCFDLALLGCLGIVADCTDSRNLIAAFSLAEKIACEQNHNVAVIAHVNQVIFYRSVQEYADYVSALLYRYPHTTLLLEHNTAISNSFGTRGVWSCTDLPNFVLEIKSKLRSDLHDRFGTVLDVCHALGNIRLRNLLESNEFIINPEYERTELRKWFAAFSTTCMLIHLNWGEKTTSGVGHGTVPPIYVYRDIKQMINTYLPEALLVLEVQEQDVDKAVNFSRFLEVIHNA